MRNILLSVMTNALGFSVVMFTNLSLLPSCNAHIGISSLFISIFSGLYSMLQRMSIVLLWFNPNAMTGYISYSEALRIVNTKAVAVLLMGL